MPAIVGLSQLWHSSWDPSQIVRTFFKVGTYMSHTCTHMHPTPILLWHSYICTSCSHLPPALSWRVPTVIMALDRIQFIVGRPFRNWRSVSAIFFLKTSEKKCWNDAVHCVQHAHNTQRAITRDQHNTNNNSQLFGSTGNVPNKANQETVVFVRIVTNTFHHVKAGSHHRHRSKNVWARP